MRSLFIGSSWKKGFLSRQVPWYLLTRLFPRCPWSSLQWLESSFSRNQVLVRLRKLSVRRKFKNSLWPERKKNRYAAHLTERVWRRSVMILMPKCKLFHKGFKTYSQNSSKKCHKGKVNRHPRFYIWPFTALIRKNGWMVNESLLVRSTLRFKTWSF